MATWFEITYTGEPTEADYARVAELAAQGFTSGQLINDGEEAGMERKWLQCRALREHDWPSKEYPKPGETQVCGRCGTRRIGPKKERRIGRKKEPRVPYQSPAPGSSTEN
jgi:hypothetical protein